MTSENKATICVSVSACGCGPKHGQHVFEEITIEDISDTRSILDTVTQLILGIDVVYEADNDYHVSTNPTPTTAIIVCGEEDEVTIAVVGTSP